MGTIRRFSFTATLIVTMLLLGIAGSLAGQVPSKRATADGSKAVVFRRVANTGIELPSVPNIPDLQDLRKPIPAGTYSVEYARGTLVPGMGGAIAIGDFDQDGNPDLYVVVPGGSNHLLRNDGKGRFTDVTSKVKVAGTGADISATFLDYDHSGHLSLAIAGMGGITLYRNNGDSTFTDVSQNSGLKGEPSQFYSYVTAVPGDKPGFPDLLAAMYTNFASAPSTASFIFPNNFPDGSVHLYRNQHDGTFQDATEASGLGSQSGRTRKIIAADFNQDGLVDLLLLRDNKPPLLYLRQKNGQFADHTAEAGEDLLIYAFLDGQAADFNHDGRMDLALWSSVGNRILLNRGGGKFVEVSMPVITEPPSPFGFRGMVAELSGDAGPDLLAADARGQWRFLQNHGGRFEQLPFSLSATREMSDGQSASHPETAEASSYAPSLFASITAFKAGKSDSLRLIALTRNGQVLIFKKASQDKTPSSLKKRSP